MIKSQLNNQYEYINENLKEILSTVNEAKIKANREDEEIHIMAVTKTVPADAVNFAIQNGIKLIGENRVQEYMSKYEDYDKNANVHFIGHLQTNKIKYIIDKVNMIESVSSIRLAKEINKRCERINKKMDVLVQINCDEESKGGIPFPQAQEFVEEVSTLENINVRGLMTIPPIDEAEEYFEKMRRLYIDISSKRLDNVSMDFLSMGMSGDFEQAILHGSNIIRIGTMLFGARK
ncbi:MAG: YggS family pyridoxal phosphate-dependent enzyme [Clostridiales bacterium]|nr:YggS family pyridoxal phosphate-dependent enzyme [Clostridiales bacterium]